MTKIQALVIVFALVLGTSGFCADTMSVSFQPTTPDNIMQQHYDHWEGVLCMSMVREWNGRMANIKIDEFSNLMSKRSFVSEMTQRFERNGWDIVFAFPETGYGVEISITPAEKKNVDFSTIEKGEYCSYTKKDFFVITNAEDWAKLWEKYGANKVAPEINFNTPEIVIVVFAGQFNTGGHSIEITQIIETKNEVQVTVKRTSPNPKSPVTMALSQPHHIVKCKWIDKPVVFKEI